MKILLTGAAGFIGMTTAMKLLARGDEVVGLDNLNDYYDVTLKQSRLNRLLPHPKFRFVKLDVADQPGMATLFAAEKFDRVIHLAAQAGGALLTAKPACLYRKQCTGLYQRTRRLPPLQGTALGLRV